MLAKRLLSAILVLSIVMTSGAFAQNLPSRVKSAAFLAAVAERGFTCNLLKPWQAASIRALLHEDTKQLTPEHRLLAIAETNRLLAEYTCETEAMAVWIEAARKGFEIEMLPPYLVAYKTLASMENPPVVFSATALRMDYAPVLAAIDLKLSELEASGQPAKGGKSWPEYIERTAKAVDEFAQSLAASETEGAKADQSAAWIAQSALIIELWMQEAN